MTASTFALLGLGLDSDPLVKGADDADRALRRTKASATDTEKAVQKLDGAIGKAYEQLRRLAAIAGVGFGVREAIGLLDAWNSVEGSLALVVKHGNTVADTHRRIFDLARRTRSEYDATASLFASLSRNAERLRMNQDQVLRITETVNKALKVGGGSTTGDTSAVRQLGQALGSGSLRGDELVSILENAPRVAQAIADAMGKSIGELRKLGAEGKLTSKIIADALLGASAKIDAEFQKMPVTIGQSFVVLKNAIGETLFNLDKANGVSLALASGVLALADNLDVAAVALGTAGVGGALTKLIPLMTTTTVTATAMWRAITGPVGLVVTAIGLVTAAYVALRREAKAAREEEERRTRFTSAEGKGLLTDTQLATEIGTLDASFKNRSLRIAGMEARLNAPGALAAGARSAYEAQYRREVQASNDEYARIIALRREQESRLKTVVEATIPSEQELAKQRREAARAAREAAQAVVAEAKAVQYLARVEAERMQAVRTAGAGADAILDRQLRAARRGTDPAAPTSAGLAAIGAAAVADVAPLVEAARRALANAQFVGAFGQMFAGAVAQAFASGDVLGAARAFAANLAGLVGQQLGDVLSRGLSNKLGAGGLGALTVGVAGAGIGFAAGRSGGTTAGVLGGVLGGAAAGAALGSVVPVLGTAVGAVVGAAAGLVGGLVGASKRAADARRVQQQAEAEEIQRQQQIAAQRAQTQYDLGQDLRLREMALAGKDAEMEALQRSIHMTEQWARALNAGASEETIERLKRITAAEQARSDALRQREREEAGEDANWRLARGHAGLRGDERTIYELGLRDDARREVMRWAAMMEAGKITAEQLAAITDLINNEVNAALAKFDANLVASNATLGETVDLTSQWANTMAQAAQAARDALDAEIRRQSVSAGIEADYLEMTGKTYEAEKKRLDERFKQEQEAARAANVTHDVWNMLIARQTRDYEQLYNRFHNIGSGSIPSDVLPQPSLEARTVSGSLYAGYTEAQASEANGLLRTIAQRVGVVAENTSAMRGGAGGLMLGDTHLTITVRTNAGDILDIVDRRIEQRRRRARRNDGDIALQ